MGGDKAILVLCASVKFLESEAICNKQEKFEHYE